MKHHAVDHVTYTLPQLMVSAAAREIANHEVIFVGMRLPLLGFLLAKSTHAPESVGVYELGVVRDTPSPEPILTMGDLPNLTNAVWLADTEGMMSLLQQGRVDAGFIGGAQVDRYGNLNTSYIGGYESVKIRLPGSGGACDLSCLARRHIIIMSHEKRRFVERVDYITSPGYGEGFEWRTRVGLPRGGPSAVITTLGVFRFDPQSKEMILHSVHPGVTSEEIKANTGWNLKVASPLLQTPAPMAKEIAMIRKFDPGGFWTGKDTLG